MELSNSTVVKTPEAETETPARIQLPVKNSHFTNGVLKRYAPLQLHHPIVVTYKECLKNHAASLGGHAVDGCGEFMPSPASNPADPTSLKCSACGCHRNFHRRDPDEQPLLLLAPPNAAPALEYRPHHRHHPPPPPPTQPRNSGGSSPNNSPSPPPISSSYYPSAPHMLLALSHGPQPPDTIGTLSPPVFSSNNSRKRFRTRFTQDQKDRMLEFAEKVDWKMQKKDEDAINEFCSEICVDRGVFKVWMHNNKNKKEDPHQPTGIFSNPPAPASNGGGISYNTAELHFRHHHDEEDSHERKENVIGINGSSRMD